MQMKKYETCFSLGCNCWAASSLAKLGLRSFSGPFDWYWSDFDSVISQIENEFADFMRKENLEIIDNKVFRDTKYNFLCNHDIKEDFEIEYAEIYDKYIRRAERFMESIKKPTCFFRIIRSEGEIKYIINNESHIEKVLKKYNSENEIVYIGLKNLSCLPDHFRWFQLTEDHYGSGRYNMRNLFSQSEELLQFCKNLLSPEQMELNKKYDNAKYRQIDVGGEVDNYVHYDIDGVQNQISTALNLQNREPFYIFGGGCVRYPLISVSA